MQTEITERGNLLKPNGELAQVGWSRQPLLDCNLESARFYPARMLQRFRVKRWDYYAFFTPNHFFSATIADLGYAGNIFVYILNFSTGELHEESLVIPFSRGIFLPRNSTIGDANFADNRAKISFKLEHGARRISVDWPNFNQGCGIQAEITLSTPSQHESMNIVIPIGEGRFYYNTKINCLPAEGFIQYGDLNKTLSPEESLGSLDWGRGVWEYNSFWQWASASGFLPDGRTIGINLGAGFGDTSHASENCVILNGRIHKLSQVNFSYDPGNYTVPWQFKDDEDRLHLEFIPFKGRQAVTNLLLIYSEVHQIFGRYTGWIQTDQGEKLDIHDLVGFAEDHHARW